MSGEVHTPNGQTIGSGQDGYTNYGKGASRVAPHGTRCQHLFLSQRRRSIYAGGMRCRHFFLLQ